MKRPLLAFCAVLLVAGALPGTAPAQSDPDFDARLLAIQQQWAHVNYEMPAGDGRNAAFEQLTRRATRLAEEHPRRAEALVWQGIAESSYAGAKGGIGALGHAKNARTALESALRIDPRTLDGSAYTSLGTLYAKVPGFPIGFGDDDKAESLLKRALEINPDGIDPNYFYAEFLHDQGRGAEAAKYLERALRAPDRPGREVADRGRRAEVAALKAKLPAKSG